MSAISPAATVVTITDGQAKAKRGTVSSILLAELTQLALDEGITTACIQATEICCIELGLKVFQRLAKQLFAGRPEMFFVCRSKAVKNLHQRQFDNAGMDLCL